MRLIVKKIFGSILVAGTFCATVPSVVVAQAGEVPPAGTVRDCRHTAFTQEGWKDFGQAKGYLVDRFGEPEKKNFWIWRADSEDAIWDVFCEATGAQARLDSDGAELKLSSPKNPYVMYGDGSTIYFRHESNSGGMSLDFVDRRGGREDKYKLHVKGEGY